MKKCDKNRLFLHSLPPNPPFSFTPRDLAPEIPSVCAILSNEYPQLPSFLAGPTWVVNGMHLTAGLSLCPSGYHGLYCEEEYNECLSAPCLNAATCRDLVNGYECVCLAEYKGERLPGLPVPGRL